jgi:hypothetical protein
MHSRHHDPDCLVVFIALDSTILSAASGNKSIDDLVDSPLAEGNLKPIDKGDLSYFLTTCDLHGGLQPALPTARVVKTTSGGLFCPSS